jgi:hypothetical protein
MVDLVRNKGGDMTKRDIPKKTLSIQKNENEELHQYHAPIYAGDDDDDDDDDGDDSDDGDDDDENDDEEDDSDFDGDDDDESEEDSCYCLYHF